MGVLHSPEVSRLFIGMLFSRQEILEPVTHVLIEAYGKALFQSPPRVWDFSDHYADELGSPVLRSFIFFDSCIDPAMLSDIKLSTNDIETKFSEGNKRKINLDPGYLTLSKVVLASTKDYSHRICLGKGIYGEVTLFFKNNRFNSFPYTYRDYREQEYLELFQRMRDRLKEEMVSACQ
jgi:hypothetical protein